MKDLKLVNVIDENSFGDGSMDVSIDSLGDINTVTEKELLLQRILKIILTYEQSDGYGSPIYNALGSKNESVVNKAYIYFVIIGALLYLRNMQINEYVRRGIALSEIKASSEILDQGLKILIFDSEPKEMTMHILLSFISNAGNITESYFTLSQ